MLSWLKRKYANWFEAPTKELKEIDVCNEWLHTYGNKNGYISSSLKKTNGQWPDCEIQNQNQQLCGIEVTELVDQAVLERVQKGEKIYRVWTDQNIIEQINERLIEKGKKSHGGKYSKLIVLLHTAEFELLFDRTDPVIQNHLFSKSQNIDEAYLIYQYEPNHGYPVSTIKFST